MNKIDFLKSKIENEFFLKMGNFAQSLNSTVVIFYLLWPIACPSLPPPHRRRGSGGLVPVKHRAFVGGNRPQVQLTSDL